MPAIRPAIILIVLLLGCAAHAAEVPVDTAAALTQAIQKAAPGDVITLAPGVYPLSGNLSCTGAGSADSPITVRAAALGDATIAFDALEGFKVSGPHWTFENLVIHGVCADDSSCEHAFHVVGAADGFTLRGNRLVNFNAHVKANGEGDPRVFPDDALIEHNELFDEAPRPDSICEDGVCDPEHQGGVMRNNIIANCPADVGIYINEGQSVRVLNNTLYNTAGIDVRFASSSAELRNNLLDGTIRARDGGVVTKSGNLEQVARADLDAWFNDPANLDFGLMDGTSIVDQGETLADVRDDFCGVARDDGRHDLGALEYVEGQACDTTTPFHTSSVDPIPTDTDDGQPDTAVSTDTTSQADTSSPTADTSDAGTQDIHTNTDTSMVPETSASGGEDGCGCALGRTAGQPLACWLVLLGLCLWGQRRRSARS